MFLACYIAMTAVAAGAFHYLTERHHRKTRP